METQNIETKHGPPGYLILKGEELETKLNASGKTVGDFANALEIEMEEAYKLLSGDKIGYEFARRFINHYGAEFAHLYIDWKAMGMSDPYLSFKKRLVGKHGYNRRNNIRPLAKPKL